MADQTEAATPPQNNRLYPRFSLSQRLEHASLLLTFTTLAITGLAQKYATSPIGEGVLGVLGGIETSRLIHRSAAIGLMIVTIYHIVAVLYRVVVQRVSLDMLPVLEDFRHLYQDVQFYLGRRKHKAYYGRYSYVEKAEYLAVVWGTIIMAFTGFFMWNPIATARWLPGEAIPAAKAAHGAEAVLAVLAILLWHFYHVHIRHFNKSIFRGHLTRQEMKHEHPAELALIEAGKSGLPTPPEVLKRRQRYFFPVAGFLTAAFGFGLLAFVTFEQTAITTVPRGETAPVFVPFTPTPTAIPTPTPSPEPGGIIVANSWQGGIGQLFANRCGSCHVQAALGGLSLQAYDQALQGGTRGQVIVPGDPQGSILVQVQSAGGHPGQLSAQELEKVVEWIRAGAPEQ